MMFSIDSERERPTKTCCHVRAHGRGGTKLYDAVVAIWAMVATEVEKPGLIFFRTIGDPDACNAPSWPRTQLPKFPAHARRSNNPARGTAPADCARKERPGPHPPIAPG